MPAGDAHIGQERNEIGLSLRASFCKNRLDLGPDRFARQTEAARDVIDGLSLEQSVRGANFGRRQVEQAIEQIIRQRLRRSERRDHQDGHRWSENVVSGTAARYQMENNGFIFVVRWNGDRPCSELELIRV